MNGKQIYLTFTKKIPVYKKNVQVVKIFIMTKVPVTARFIV